MPIEEQLDLFEDAPEEKDFSKPEERLDLSSIDFSTFPLDQIEKRKELILAMLKANTAETKEQIINDVLSLPILGFDAAYEIYRRKYLTDKYKIPKKETPSAQQRFPFSPPEIQLLPTEEEEAEKSENVKKHYEEKQHEYWGRYVEKDILPVDRNFTENEYNKRLLEISKKYSEYVNIISKAKQNSITNPSNQDLADHMAESILPFSSLKNCRHMLEEIKDKFIKSMEIDLSNLDDSPILMHKYKELFNSLKKDITDFNSKSADEILENTRKYLETHFSYNFKTVSGSGGSNYNQYYGTKDIDQVYNSIMSILDSRIHRTNMIIKNTNKVKRIKKLLPEKLDKAISNLENVIGIKKSHDIFKNQKKELQQAYDNFMDVIIHKHYEYDEQEDNNLKSTHYTNIFADLMNFENVLAQDYSVFQFIGRIEDLFFKVTKEPFIKINDRLNAQLTREVFPELLDNFIFNNFGLTKKDFLANDEAAEKFIWDVTKINNTTVELEYAYDNMYKELLSKKSESDIFKAAEEILKKQNKPLASLITYPKFASKDPEVQKLMQKQAFKTSVMSIMNALRMMRKNYSMGLAFEDLYFQFDQSRKTGALSYKEATPEEYFKFLLESHKDKVYQTFERIFSNYLTQSDVRELNSAFNLNNYSQIVTKPHSSFITGSFEELEAALPQNDRGKYSSSYSERYYGQTTYRDSHFLIFDFLAEIRRLIAGTHYFDVITKFDTLIIPFTNYESGGGRTATGKTIAFLLEQERNTLFNNAKELLMEAYKSSKEREKNESAWITNRGQLEVQEKIEYILENFNKITNQIFMQSEVYCVYNSINKRYLSGFVGPREFEKILSAFFNKIGITHINTVQLVSYLNNATIQDTKKFSELLPFQWDKDIENTDKYDKLLSLKKHIDLYSHRNSKEHISFIYFSIIKKLKIQEYSDIINLLEICNSWKYHTDNISVDDVKPIFDYFIKDFSNINGQIKNLITAASLKHNHSDIPIKDFIKIVKNPSFHKDSKASKKFIEACLLYAKLGKMEGLKNNKFIQEEFEVKNQMFENFWDNISKFDKLFRSQSGIKANLMEKPPEMNLDILVEENTPYRIDESDAAKYKKIKTIDQKIEFLLSLQTEYNNKYGPTTPEFEEMFRKIKNIKSTGQSKQRYLYDMKVNQIISYASTILTYIKDAQIYREYTKKAQKKIPELFRLNMEFPTKKFRFRVLNDRDPRHFSIGEETNCCQRIGGVGQNAAIDSYVNKEAGVVVLELLIDGEWQLASQSYFHYVPKKNGFILDNIESKSSVFSKCWGVTGYSAEQLYAALAKEIEKRYNVSFFLCGKQYNKISNKSFSTGRVKGGDPRNFAHSKYTDFSPSDAVDLLKPKSEPPDLSELQQKISQRVSGLIKLAFASLYNL